MSRADTWMPLYVADYLGDTGHLMGPEHGAYLLLLMHYWRTGPLPDDDAMLARIARTEARAWGRMAPMIRAFFVADGGRLHQKRLDAERARAEQITSKRAAAASARWGRVQSKPGGDAEHLDSKGNANASGLDMPGTSPLQPQEQKKASDLRSDAPGASGGGLFGALPSDRAPSMRATLFEHGLPILRALTGKGEGQCRGLIGKWLAGMDDDCGRLYAILREAEALRPADPMAWLTAAAGRHGGGLRKVAGGGKLAALVAEYGGGE